jgi:ribosomal protein S18 acetylase RimI-like enzyme
MNLEGQTDSKTLETAPKVIVRSMRQEDLDAVVAIDAVSTGRQRPHYFRRMLERTVKEADFQISLVAEVEGVVAGCVIATLFYGEYGVMEPAASIDAIGVLEAYRRQHVGMALMRQLRLNLSGLRIESIRTEVLWDDFELLRFFKSEGFKPGTRICLERSIDPTQPER